MKLFAMSEPFDALWQDRNSRRVGDLFTELQDKQFEEHRLFLAHLEMLNKRQINFKESQAKQFQDHRMWWPASMTSPGLSTWIMRPSGAVEPNFSSRA